MMDFYVEPSPFAFRFVLILDFTFVQLNQGFNTMEMMMYMY